MSTRRSSMTLSVLLVACGGDPGGGDPIVDAAVDAVVPDAAPPLSCDFPGSAVWTGSYPDVVLGPITSAWTAVEADGAWWIVGIDEAGGRCLTATTPGGPPPADGYQNLDLIFDGVPAAGSYVVRPFNTPNPPADTVWIALDRREGTTDTNLAQGVSGTVVIDEVDLCVRGSFDVTFASGTVSGSFAAYLCNGPGVRGDAP